jgi:hypothetical protein
VNNSSAYQTTDLAVVICANIFNLMMVAIFSLRIGNYQTAERIVGLVQFPLAIVFGISAIYNWVNGREIWMVVLPGLMVIFILVELLLDYILKVPFRSTRLLWPYLLFYYTAQMGLIGYSFLVNQAYGFITLATYFLSLGATGYSYSKVGHGQR